ncbi:nitrile hydratase subunit alpha [Halobacteriales archaeon QS_6_64_34]|nr:MAG: nitrile hydratase subunit alpha [Halobacteriales archaeon QS_6_64_34]
MSKTIPVDKEEDNEARARALQSLLIEKEMLSTDAIDAIISKFEDDIGPMNGAEVVARAWTDNEFKKELINDSTAAINAEFGHTGMESVDVEVYENTPDVHNVVICTLCSCFAWPLLGLPPTWFKSGPYRAQMIKHPRKTLREDFEVDLDEDVEIRVWDQSAEVRYMILPQRPKGTEGMDESELAELVTRDSMIGVERIGDKHADELK